MTKATPESSDSLVFECDFEEPPEKVWRALTEPRLLEAWLTAEEPSPTDSAKGSSRAGSAQERPVPSRPRPQPGDYGVLTAEPHRFLRYLWRDREHDREGGGGHSGDREVHSIVTVELAPGAAGGTHLRLTHGEFRIVSIAPAITAARVRPITSARRQIRIQSFAGPTSWRRAA